MKQLQYYVILFLAFTMSGVVNAGSTHRFATFNIRYVPDGGEPEGRDWSARAESVRDVVLKYSLDIVGFQELTGDGRSYRNSKTGRSQLNDMKSWLEERGYVFHAWDRDGSQRKEYVGLAYLKDKYEEIERGEFFISPTPEVYSHGWDVQVATHSRNVGWVKLKVKSTGEIFYYAVSHTNNGYTLDGVYGSDLVAKKMQGIAGDFPVMIVADYNMQRIEYNSRAYKGYMQLFRDAKIDVPSDKNYCLPEGVRQIDGTYNRWEPLSNLNNDPQEIDYQFFRQMKIHERHILAEDYSFGGKMYPVSDHYPVMCVAELLEPRSPQRVYVNCAQSGDGVGTISNPYSSLATAAANVEHGDTIYVTEGVYKESIAPSGSVTILGGYSSDYKEIIGKTEIDATEFDYPAIYVPSSYWLNLKNFVIKNYASQNSTYDGALHFRGSSLSLENVDFYNNVAKEFGGAISTFTNKRIGNWADCNDFELKNCRFKSNKAQAGGGVAVSFYRNLRISGCTFDGNSADEGSAVHIGFGVPATNAVWFSNAEGLIVNTSFVDNIGVKSGAVSIDDDMPKVKVGIVNCTFAGNALESKGGLASIVKSYGGSALMAKMSGTQTNGTASAPSAQINLGHVTIVGNTAKVASSGVDNYLAGAVNINGGEAKVLNSIIAGNYTNGTTANADVTIGESATLKKDSYNIFSHPKSINFSVDSKSYVSEDIDKYAINVASLMDGVYSDGSFKPNIWREENRTPVVRLISKSYGDKNIAILSVLTRNIEREFAMDVDGNGEVGNQLKQDQWGRLRNSSSVPGSIEYDPEFSEIEDLINGDAIELLSQNDKDVYHIIGEEREYRIIKADGIQLEHRLGNTINLHNYPCGMYMIIVDNHVYKIFKK